MYSSFSSNVLASNFEQMIDSFQNSSHFFIQHNPSHFNQNNHHYTNPTHSQTGLSHFNHQQYSMWNDLNVSSSNSSSSKSSNSVSPNSSITHLPNNNRSVQHSSSVKQHNKNKLELPSQKTNIDVDRYLQQSARILQKNPNKVIVCTFCKNNGEPEHIYRSHQIKDFNGKVTCPLLKVYKCPACGESGDRAHTITYCKKYKAQKRSELLNNF